MLPVLAKIFRSRKRSVGRSWRMDETDIRVNGEWKCLYRALDKLGHTVDFWFQVPKGAYSGERDRRFW